MIDIQIQNINESVAIDDIVYYSSTSSTFGSTNHHYQTSGQLHELGPIVEIFPGLGIRVDNSANNNVPGTGDFLMFSKDKTVNTSGLAGYYAEATFKNDSVFKAELFSVSSDIEISSK